MTSTSEPCVCVQDAQKKSVGQGRANSKPQDCGVCPKSHTVRFAVLLLCCCFVGMHIASRSGGNSTKSTSNLLAQSCGGLA